MKRSFLVLLLLGLSATASAQGFDYNYVQLDYGVIDFANINIDGDGFTLGGSLAINSDAHVFGSYQSADLDFGVDASTFNLGIGYNTELSPRMDAYARASFEFIELDFPGIGSFDDNGFGFGVGVRFAASDKLELDGGIKYVKYGDAGSDTGIEVGALYNFTEAFTLGLTGDWSDDFFSYNLVARYYFGR